MDPRRAQRTARGRGCRARPALGSQDGGDTARSDARAAAEPAAPGAAARAGMALGVPVTHGSVPRAKAQGENAGAPGAAWSPRTSSSRRA